ncbi:Mobile element protein [Pseudomonas coronafaciens pv. garcae]|nr:Mobile element protein [Pseudomonas coronafaciens pv. garcae]RMV82839.1 Mobile element protein [Pseudomonas coronafaciens pv. garcae]
MFSEFCRLPLYTKRQFGYTKVRFRGLAKNTAQQATLFALSNLWMVRKRLLAMGEVRL